MTADRLALDGGSPVRAEWLPFHRPLIEEDEIDEVVKTLRSGWLTTGPRVKQFEREMASYLGAAHAVAVNSCTAALHLALEAIGLKPGDEVVIPTYTFAATGEVITYFGARPVLVDIERDTLNVSPDAVESALTAKTRAIISVDIAGVPCDFEPILDLAKAKGLVLIDDAAHAIPSRYQGRMVGSIADMTALSFYATKTLTTGEGGMLLTDNPEYAERAALMSLHGLSRDAWKRYTSEGTWYYEVVAPGFKYNLTDVAAAIGLVQLTKQERLLGERRSIAERYSRAFAAMPELEAPTVPVDRETSWHLYIPRLELDRLTCDRAMFVRALAAENVGASVHFIPLHLHPWYRQTYGYNQSLFPVAQREYERALSLPIYPGMSDDDVSDVIAAVAKLTAHYRR